MAEISFQLPQKRAKLACTACSAPSITCGIGEKQLCHSCLSSNTPCKRRDSCCGTQTHKPNGTAEVSRMSHSRLYPVIVSDDTDVWACSSSSSNLDHMSLTKCSSPLFLAASRYYLEATVLSNIDSLSTLEGSGSQQPLPGETSSQSLPSLLPPAIPHHQQASDMSCT